MSRYTAYDLFTDVTSKIHGGSINNPQRALDEGRRRMLRNIKPPELVRSSYMEQATYDRVDRYAVAEDLRYDNIIEVHLLSAYRNVDTLQHPLELVFRRQFDQKRRGSRNVINITNENGVKYAQISHLRGQKECQYLTINKADSLDQNGTWNTGGNVTNLRLDELNHITGHASLKFDINDSTNTGFIENFTMQTVDITDYLNLGATFAWLSLPIPKEMLSVKITLGSNQTNLTTDFYTATVDQPHDNNEFITGWNLLKYMLNNLNSTGNPNPRKIGYVRFDFTTTGRPIANCNLDAVVARKGVVYYYLYNSQYCLIDPVTKAWKQRLTSNADIVVAEEDTYTILMLETALSVQQELYANNFGAASDVSSIQSELNEAYYQYRLYHTDETLEPSEDTYIFGDFMNGYTGENIDQTYGDESGEHGAQGNAHTTF